MLAGFAPDNKPDLGSGGGAERHRWAGFGFHGLLENQFVRQ
jgi:hypothetical protein